MCERDHLSSVFSVSVHSDLPLASALCKCDFNLSLRAGLAGLLYVRQLPFLTCYFTYGCPYLVFNLLAPFFQLLLLLNSDSQIIPDLAFQEGHLERNTHPSFSLLFLFSQAGVPGWGCHPL